MSGHNVSHSIRRTKRKFEPNLKKISLKSDALNIKVTLRVASKTLRTINKYGNLDAFLVNFKPAKLTEKAKKIRNKIIKALTKQKKLGKVKVVKKATKKKTSARKSKIKAKVKKVVKKVVEKKKTEEKKKAVKKVVKEETKKPVVKKTTKTTKAKKTKEEK